MPDVLMPSSYTTDGILLIKTMAELGYKANAIVAQAAGFSEKALYDAVGDKLERRDLARQLLARSRGQAADGRQDQRHVQGEVGQGSQRLHLAPVHGPDRDGRRDQSRQVHRWR